MKRWLPIPLSFTLIVCGCAEQPPQSPVPTTLTYGIPVITPETGTPFVQTQGGITAEIKPVTYSPVIRYKVSLELNMSFGKDMLASIANGGNSVDTYDVTFAPVVSITPNDLEATLTITNNSLDADVDATSPRTSYVGVMNGHKVDDIVLPAFTAFISPHSTKSDLVHFQESVYGEDTSKPSELRLDIVGLHMVPMTSGRAEHIYNFEWKMNFEMQSRQIALSTVKKQIQLTDAQAGQLKDAVVDEAQMEALTAGHQ